MSKVFFLFFFYIPIRSIIAVNLHGTAESNLHRWRRSNRPVLKLDFKFRTGYSPLSQTAAFTYKKKKNGFYTARGSATAGWSQQAYGYFFFQLFFFSLRMGIFRHTLQSVHDRANPRTAILSIKSYTWYIIYRYVIRGLYRQLEYAHIYQTVRESRCILFEYEEKTHRPIRNTIVINKCSKSDVGLHQFGRMRKKIKITNTVF